MVVAIWTGREAQALRVALRMTIEGFAEHLGVAARTVAKWEALGAEIVPLPAIQEVLDTALEQATVPQRTRFDLLRRRHRVPGEELWKGGRITLDTAWEGDILDDVNRRTFLLGAPAAFLLPRAWLRQPPGSWAQGRMLSADAVETLAAMVAADKRLHDRLGSRAVQGTLAEHARLTTGLMQGSPPPGLRPRLASVASEAAAEAGLACYDQGQLPAAESYYRLAAELAREAGNPLLQAYVLGAWGRKLTPSGEAPEALRFLDAAHALAGRGAPPRMVAYLAAAEAEARASLGDDGAGLRALERAGEASDRGDASEDAPWLYWLDTGQLSGSKGRCAMHLGRLEEAEALLGLSLSAWDPSFVRDRAFTLVDLASLRLRQDEIEECCRLAAESLEVAVATGSPRIVRRVRDLRRELRPWSDSPAVRTLDEQMATASWF